VLLPATGRRDKKVTYAPDSLTNKSKAPKGPLIALGLGIVTSSPPTWKSSNGNILRAIPG